MQEGKGSCDVKGNENYCMNNKNNSYENTPKGVATMEYSLTNT